MRKQRTFQGSYSYSDCEKFVSSMDNIFEVRKVVFEKIPDKDYWVTKWRVIVFYKNE